MNKKLKDYRVLLVIGLATLFGLSGGVVGSLLAKAYLFDNFYEIPFFGELDFSEGYGGQELIIRNAKKVIVEQETKINETINSVSGSLVGVFKKQKAAETDSALGADKYFDLYNYYKLDQPLGQGLIITSDGWVATNLPIELANYSDYVVITKDKKVYAVDKIVKDSLTPFSFLHVQARDFSVRRFSEREEIKNGNLVLGVSWTGESWLSSIVGERKSSSVLVNYSDNFLTELVLANNSPQEFEGMVLFNLSGDVVALIDDEGVMEPINHLTTAISSLLKNKEIKRAGLGVNYINLARLAEVNNLGPESPDKGAVIYKALNGIAIVKGSPADLAGLEEGDIIISVDNTEINETNDLVDVIQSYVAGEKVRIIYLRGNIKNETEVLLEELK